MRANIHLTATMLVITAIFLSGCTDAGPRSDDAGLDGLSGSDGVHAKYNPDSHPASNEAADEAPEETANRLPALDVVPDITSGEAPLTVNFTINASDEDGDALTWTIDFDGDAVADVEGNTTEAVVEHTFTDAGDHAVDVTVSDGTNTTTEQVVIEVVEAVAEFTGPEPISHSGEMTYITQFGCIDPVAFATSAGGEDGYYHWEAPVQAGWIYSVDPAEARFTDWWTGLDARVAQQGPVGTVPEGADNVGVCPETDTAEPQAAYTITFYPPDHPDAPTL